MHVTIVFNPLSTYMTYVSKLPVSIHIISLGGDLLDHITCTISTKQVEAHEKDSNDNNLPFSYTFIFNNNALHNFNKADVNEPYGGCNHPIK
jgi:hypothetical protein